MSFVASMENLISSLDEFDAMFSHESMDMEIKKDQEVVTEKIKSLSERLSEIKMEIELLDAQMGCVLDQRDKAFERIKILRIQRDKGVRFLPLSSSVKSFCFSINWILKMFSLSGVFCFCRMPPFSRVVLS